MSGSDDNESRQASMIAIAVGWNATASGARVRNTNSAATQLEIPEARLQRRTAEYRVSVEEGAHVYEFGGLDLSLPIEAPGCLLKMIERALFAEEFAGRTAGSITLMLVGAETRELPTVSVESWAMDMSAALACFVAELQEFGEVSTFDVAHIVLAAERAIDFSSVGVMEIAGQRKLDLVVETPVSYVDEIPGLLQFPRASL